MITHKGQVSKVIFFIFLPRIGKTCYEVTITRVNVVNSFLIGHSINLGKVSVCKKLFSGSTRQRAIVRIRDPSNYICSTQLHLIQGNIHWARSEYCANDIISSLIILSLKLYAHSNHMAWTLDISIDVIVTIWSLQISIQQSS